MPVKESFSRYQQKEILNSKISDMFDFENTLPTSVQISDNVIDCIRVLRDDEQCHEGALVKNRDKYVGIITGRELSASLLSNGAKKFAEQPVGDCFSTNYTTLTEDTTLLDFIQKMQRSRRGFGLVIKDQKMIGKLSIRDVVALYLKMGSHATLGDFPLHEMISVPPTTSIKESLLLMMKNQIRKIFLEDKLCPFISERNILSLVAKCVSKNDYDTLDKPVSECEKSFAITLKEERIKDACKKLLLSNSTCIIYNNRYVFTSWDIATSFLIERIHDYQKQLVSSEKLAMIGEISARLNHELKNPLSIIKNSAELFKLKSKELNKEQMEYISMIERAVIRMAHQIDDVLDFAKINELSVTKSSMLTLVNEALEDVPIPSEISLVKNIQDYYLLCDRAKMRVVIRNLILNAIDAILEKRGGKKEIRINTRQEKNISVLEIRDSGVGISDADLKRVFEPLYTTKQKGTGLGLAISKIIIELHMGDIFVFSKVNEGTTVTILLPVKHFDDVN